MKSAGRWSTDRRERSWAVRLNVAALLSLLLLLPVTPGLRIAHAVPGDPDPAFGVGGKVTTDFGGTENAFALVRQPDGKLVAAGSSGANFALARYNAYGSLDATFGVGGLVMTDVGNVGAARALVRQPDGKLVAAGSSGANFALARYHPDGTLDAGFGTGGLVTTDFGDTEDAHALVLQPDGKLVAAGSSGANFALARYHPDGTLDGAFGVGGKVTTGFRKPGAAYALVRQPDGKLVAAGSVDSLNTWYVGLVRYHPDGTLDDTFGLGGKATTDFGDPAAARALVLQPDGKLVAAGSAGANCILARYNADGSPDSAFGASGKVITDFGDNGGANALVLQPDGKLVAAGRSSKNFILARYNADGSPDTGFGVGGKATIDFGGTDEASALVLHPGGWLVAAGVSSANFALARYLGDGTTGIRMLTITKTGPGSDPGVPEQRSFRTTDPIVVMADYYDPADTCAAVDPATVKFFAFTLEGRLILGRNRDAAAGGVTNSRIGTSKYQALVATLDPGALPAGAYNLIFIVEDCARTALLESELYAIEVLKP